MSKPVSPALHDLADRLLLNHHTLAAMVAVGTTAPTGLVYWALVASYAAWTLLRTRAQPGGGGEGAT